MAKNSIPDFSATAASNTDIQSVNIDENCPASGINNAIRELMVDLKNVDTGAVALTSPQFATASMTGNLTLGDSNKAIFGAGSDLQISHDSNNSRILDSGTGDLYIGGDNTVHIVNAGVSSTKAQFITDGAVNLFHNNSQKLATTSSGISVTGGVVASGGLSINSYGDPSNNYITLRPSFAPSASGGVGFAAKDHDGANNDGLGVFGHDGISFTTGGSEQMRLDSSGHLLLNNTAYSSNGTLVVQQTADSKGIAIVDSAAANTLFLENDGTINKIRNNASVPIAFETASTERLRILADGSVGIGTSTPNNFNANAKNLVVGTGSGSNGISIFAGNSSDSAIFFADNGSTATGQINYKHADNAFTFHTNGGTERMRIDSGGNVLAISGTIGGLGSYNNTTSAAANVNILSSGVLVRSTSSRRYKNTITDATHGLTELLALRPVTYKGNNDGDTIFGGLIAEEVHDAGLTEFVTYNDDNEPDALAYGNMVSLCIKAIQEQQTTIKSLEQRIAALEA